MSEIFPLNLAKNTDKLKELIAEYPDYPIIVLASETSWDGDNTATFCSYVTFSVDEILDCETPYGNDGYVCCDRDDFDDRLGEWLWDELGGSDKPPKITEEEFQKKLEEEKAKYEPYWKKVIAIWADN